MNRKVFGKIRHKGKRAFLRGIANTANVLKAARLAGMDRDNHYLWLKSDPDYREAFEIAWDMAMDAMEAEAARRAFEGVLKPVYHAGKRAIDVQLDEEGKIVRDAEGNAVAVPAAIREFSDSLLMFVLKGNRGAKYRDNVSVDQRFVDRAGGDRPLDNTRDLLIAALEGQSDEVKAAVARKLMDMG
jgi:hypothetical protein